MTTDPKFTDLLDEYLLSKAAFDQYQESSPDYGPGGQMLYDRMDDAKKALNALFAPPKESE